MTNTISGTVDDLFVRVGQRLPAPVLSARVHREQSSPTTFAELIDERFLSLFVFVRQFGCAACVQRTQELSQFLSVLTTTRTKVVLVGCGSPQQLGVFADNYALAVQRIDGVVDPTLSLHRLLGLRRSYVGVLGPVGTFHLLRAMGRGFPNHWGQGDFYQLGGTLLVDSNAQVLALHRERHLGDGIPFATLGDQLLIALANRSQQAARV